MLARHFSHMLYAPKHSLEDADKAPAKPFEIIIYTALLALIPTLCGYHATVNIGWDLGAGAPFMIAEHKAMYIAIAAYALFNIGVYAMGFGICWLAKTFDVEPDPMHCIELALFASVPLFVAGFAALYPVLIVDIMVGFAAAAASAYLLYTGVPIFMHISQEKGFVYSTWVVSLGLVMITLFLGISIFIFSWLS
jgi:hypothetical protein